MDSSVEKELEEDEGDDDVPELVNLSVLGDPVRHALDVALACRVENTEAQETWENALGVVHNTIEEILDRDFSQDKRIDLNHWDLKFVSIDLPQLVWKLFFGASIPVQSLPLVVSIFKGILALAIHLAYLDLNELNRCLLMILDGPVHTPRTTTGSLANGAVTTTVQGSELLQACASTYAAPGITPFYSAHGRPLQIQTGLKDWTSYWPHEAPDVEKRMNEKVGQVVDLTPLQAASEDHRSPERVKIAGYSLSRNMYEVRLLKHSNSITNGTLERPRIVWLDLNQYNYELVSKYDPQSTLVSNTTRDIGKKIRFVQDLEGIKKASTGIIAGFVSGEYVIEVDSEENEGSTTFRISEQSLMESDCAIVGAELPRTGSHPQLSELTERLVQYPPANGQSAPSFYYVDILNWFCQSDGFDRLTKRIADRANPIPLMQMVHFIRALLSAFPVMHQKDSKLWQSYADQMLSAAENRIASMSDQELRSIQTEPKVLWYITTYMSKLSPETHAASYGGTNKLVQQSIAERIILQVMIQYLSMASIESRLFGLRNILDAIRSYSNFSGSLMNVHTPRQDQRPPTYAFNNIGKEWLLDWLQEVDIVSRLYHGKNLHFELLRRSTSVVLFLGREGRILDSYLKIIWDASVGRDSATAKIIHSLLISLVSRISHSQRMSFFKFSVACLPIAEYDEAGETLRFVFDITTLALEADNNAGKSNRPPFAPSGSYGLPSSPLDILSPSSDIQGVEDIDSSGVKQSNSTSTHGSEEAKQRDMQHERNISDGLDLFSPDDYWYGLSILWNFILDEAVADLVAANKTKRSHPDSEISSSQRKEAIVLLVRLLSEDAWCASQRNNVMESCIHNLKQGHSVPQSLDMLKRIINSMPQSKSSWFSLSENRRPRKEIIIEKLEKQHKLVKLICDDLGRYQADVKTIFAELQDMAQIPPIQQQIIDESTEVDNPVPISPRRSSKWQILSTAIPSVPVDDLKLPGSCYTHLDQLGARFDFLLFVLTNSYLSLKRSAAKELWSAMVVGALSTRAKDVALSWFGKAQASGGSSVILSSSASARPGSAGSGNTDGPKSKTQPSNVPTSVTNGGATPSTTPMNVADSSKPRSPIGGDKQNGANLPGSNALNGDADLSSVLKNTVLADDVPLALFRDEMQSLDEVRLSPVGLRVYQSFFLSINYRNKALRRAGDAGQNSGQFLSGRRTRRNQEARALARAIVGSQEASLFEFVERNSTQVEGMDFIWRAALESERNDVGFSAISLLVHMHVRLGPKLKTKRTRLYYDFLQKCVKCVTDATIGEVVENNRTASIRRARRASTILKLFLSHFKKHRLPKQINLVIIPPAIGFPGSLTRREWISMGVGTSFSVSVTEDTKLRKVREAISSQIKVPAHAVDFRLVNNPCRSTVPFKRLGVAAASPSGAGHDLGSTATDLEEWFGSSDYISFSKHTLSHNQESGSSQQRNGFPNLHTAFAEADMDKTLAELSIQDWDTLKVLDVKVEKPAAKNGQAQPTPPPATAKTPAMAQTQQNAGQVAKPIIEKALQIGYGPVASVCGAGDGSESRSVIPTNAMDSTLLRYDSELENTYSSLFELLDASVPSIIAQDAVAAQQIWDSLLLLPADDKIVRDLTDLSLDWQALLPLGSTHRLLYSLRLIDSIFLSGENGPFHTRSGSAAFASALDSSASGHPRHSASSNHSTNDAWIHKFVSQGGLDHLIHILIRHDQLVGGRRVDCLCHLVKIISELLFGDEDFRQRMSTFLFGSESGTVTVTQLQEVEKLQQHNQHISSVDTSSVSTKEAPPSSGEGQTAGSTWFHRRNLSTSSTSSSGGSGGGKGVEVGVNQVSDRAALKVVDSTDVSTPPPSNQSEESAFRRFSAKIKNRAKLIGTTIKRGSDSGNSKTSSVRQETAIEGDGSSQIVKCVLEAMLDASISGVSNEGLRRFVEFGLQLIMSCVCFGGTKTVVAIMCFQDLRSLTERLVLYSEDPKVRSTACEGILTLCSLIDRCTRSTPGYWERKAFTLSYLRILLPIVKTLHVPIRTDLPGGMLARRAHRNLSQNCTEFYTLLCGLIRLVDLHDPGQQSGATNESKEDDQFSVSDAASELYRTSQAFFQTMFDRATEALLMHESLESFHSIRVDHLMIGLIQLVRALIEKCPDLKKRATHCGLVMILYQDFLFAYGYGSGEFEGCFPSNQNTSLDSTISSNSPPKKNRVKGLLRRSLSGQSLILHDRSSRCKTEASRDMCMALLVELCSGCLTNLDHLTKLIEEDGLGGSERKEFKKNLDEEWNYNPLTLAKHPNQFTGLKNQGATCYMNALLQQLYHIPSFAEAILSMRAQRTSLLHQLQVTFGSLRVSTRHYYDTMPLCLSLAELDGTPINLSEQKDANEFATQVFDKLESESLDAKHALRDHFGGVLINQIISKDPENPYVSERAEPFLILPLDIRGHSNLANALGAMVESELLTGENQYRLDSGETVDAIKRTCIKTPPNHLIINLKRFEFDLQTLTKHKLNDRFEFPFVLDLEPYTYDFIAKSSRVGSSAAPRQGSQDQASDGQESVSSQTASSEHAHSEIQSEGSGKDSVVSSSEDGNELRINVDTENKIQPKSMSAPAHEEEDQTLGGSFSQFEYELVGVIAHSGTMDSGHYFSFVRERKAKFPQVGGQWMEFNDKLVWPYPIDCIPADCFGGTETIKKADGTPVQVTKQRSAYILIYDRKVKSSMSRVEPSVSLLSDVLVPDFSGDFDESLDASEGEEYVEDEEFLFSALDDSEILEARRRSSTGDSSLLLDSEELMRIPSPSRQHQEHPPSQQRQEKESQWSQFVANLGVDEEGARLLQHFMFVRQSENGFASNGWTSPRKGETHADAEGLFALGASETSMTRLPSHVVEAILKDNLVFTSHNYVFHPSTYKFAWNVLQIARESGDEAVVFRALRLWLRFLVSVAGHAWAPFVDETFAIWEEQLTSMLVGNHHACRWLLEEHATVEWIQTVFNHCPKQKLKILMENLLAAAMLSLARPLQHRMTSGETTKADGTSDGDLPEPPSFDEALMARFIDRFLEAFGSVKNLGESPYYFRTLLTFCQLGATYRRHLLSHQPLLGELVEVYTANTSLKPSPQEYVSTVHAIAATIVSMVQTHLVDSFRRARDPNSVDFLGDVPADTRNEDGKPDETGTKAAVSDPLESIIHNAMFLSKILINDFSLGAKVIVLGSLGSEQRSQSALAFLFDRLKKESMPVLHSVVSRILKVIKSLLVLSDDSELKKFQESDQRCVFEFWETKIDCERCKELARIRTEFIVPKLVKLLGEFQRQIAKGEYFVYHCSKLLLSCAASNATVREKLIEHQREMEAWMKR